VARVTATIDQPYLGLWKDRVGHLLMFEAMPEAGEAVRLLLDEACACLSERGMEAARNGFGLFDMPYNTDAYDVLPPSLMRQNGPSHHRLIKAAGFETEKGFVDYALEVTSALVERWQGALDAARKNGFEIVPFRDVPTPERGDLFCALWNEAFERHWGWCPVSPEITGLFVPDGVPLLDTSVFAYANGEPVGFCFVNPDDPAHATLAPGRDLRPSEKLNTLAIGVRQRARGRGVNHAMAGYAFLELARRGWTHLAYTLVLDDNWPSRRTGEGLGASLCANYVAYRRNLRR
jgi:GNAT superfamily N-acetyltransferase